MNKILLALNAKQLNTKSVDFAAFVAGITNSKLTGVFLEKVLHENTARQKTPFGLAYVETITAKDEETAQDKEQIERNIALFKNACTNRNITSIPLWLKGAAADEIIKESRFADLILVDANTSLEYYENEGTPTKFVKSLLENAECPVCITPESFDAVEEIIFTYSGDESSVYAIKQFTYLFPMFSTKKVLLVYVAENEEKNIQDAARIKDWLNTHYTNVVCDVMEGEAEYELLAKFLTKRDAILVMGAFGRDMVSRFFKHSTAELILKIINLPVFIAHR